jgi:hypothetical protein
MVKNSAHKTTDRAALVAEDRAEVLPAMADREDERHDRRRADHPPADQLDGVELLEVTPIERQRSPDQVGRDAGDDATLLLRGLTALLISRLFSVQRHWLDATDGRRRWPMHSTRGSGAGRGLGRAARCREGS